MNDVELILKWIRETDVRSLPYDVVAVGWGPKQKNGIRTGEYGLIFTVGSKKPLTELKEHEIIPAYLSIIADAEHQDITVITDVKEPVVVQKLINFCHTASNTTEPVKQNRVSTRPLKGGCEAMTRWGSGYVGTLGLFARDKTDGQIVALSNNHVFADSQVSSDLLAPNESGSTNTLQSSAYQPTGYWRTTAQNDYIGICKRPVLIGDVSPDIVTYFGTSAINETSCDAAVLKLADYGLINGSDSPNIINLSAFAPFEFATDAEIDSLAPGATNEAAPIFRSGRTLGPIGFPGNTFSCNLSVSELNWALVGEYSGYLSWFSNCFYVEGDVAPGAGGDSGSALLALYNQGNQTLSAWKVIGLLFAGPETNEYTIGCRITKIQQALNITHWDTTIPTLSSKQSTVLLPNTYSSTVTLSGRTFYQVGYL